MRVAVAGCVEGELDRVYDAVRRVNERHGVSIDLLICCGNFEAVRDEEDLEILNAPPKWKRMKDFSKYYRREKEAPVLTIFVGGMHESPNLLRELYFGGWVAPNIFYMGYAGVVRVGALRICGLSGVFKGGDYFRGHYEFPPYTDSTKRSAYAVRDWDVARLEKIGGPIDIVVSYDWPRGIWRHGPFKELLANEDLESDARREMEGGNFGSPAAMELLNALRPGFWFAGRLGAKFPALVPHKDGTFTRFLNLDRCIPGKDFLQVLDVDPQSSSFLQKLPQAGEKPRWRSIMRRAAADGGPTLDYDPEWLAVQKVNHASLSFSYKTAKAALRKPTKEEVSWVLGRLRAAPNARVIKRAPDATRRHNLLLPVAQREGGSNAFRELSTSQLRELFETRGLEFPGHLDKVSLLRKLQEHDDFFAAERRAVQVADGDAFPIKATLKRGRDEALMQRTAMLELLDLEDCWAQQEAELKKQKRPEEADHDYDPFNEAPQSIGAGAATAAPAVSAETTIAPAAGAAAEEGSSAPAEEGSALEGGDGDRDDEESDDDGGAPPLENDGAVDDEDDEATALPLEVEEVAGVQEFADASASSAVACAALTSNDSGDEGEEVAEIDPYSELMAEVEAADEEDADCGEGYEEEPPAKLARV